MDHLLHGAQGLFLQAVAIGAPQGHNASLSITFEVSPFLHDLTYLWEDTTTCERSSIYLLKQQPDAAAASTNYQRKKNEWISQCTNNKSYTTFPLVKKPA